MQFRQFMELLEFIQHANLLFIGTGSGSADLIDLID